QQRYTRGAPLIDACVHPALPRSDDLLQYLDETWRHRLFPPLDRHRYPSPIGEYRPDAQPGVAVDTAIPGRQPGDVARQMFVAKGRAPTPGSDPELLTKHVLEDEGAEYAILLPLTRG